MRGSKIYQACPQACFQAVFLAPLVIGLAVLPGCGGSRFNARPLLADVKRFETETQQLPVDSTAAAILKSAQIRRDQALPLLERENHKAARPVLELALADVRAANAMALADAARQEADGCLREVEAARQRLEQTRAELAETEQVAGPAPWDVPEVTADMSAATPEGLPGTSLSVLTPPTGSAAQLSTLWMAWRDAALDHGVPLADLENRFSAHLAAATDEKTKDADRPRHLYMAGRVIQELEARIQREVALRACARASDVLSQLADARDDALHATLRLERGLQGTLRTQLEDARLQAETRQQQLFSSLQQLEGKFARITQEARGTIVSLSDILFDFDRATLKREVEFNLVRVATILNQFPEMGVGVEGHTDNVGTAEYNLELSERRAQAVYDFLVSQGVAASRMTSAGYGMTRPVADNGTAEGRQRNRRVDLVIQESH
jgi:outer membrane protein OmpA-like peptidoglycan-associated protein